LEVTLFIKKYSQSLEPNSNVHEYNTQRNMIFMFSHTELIYTNRVK